MILGRCNETSAGLPSLGNSNDNVCFLYLHCLHLHSPSQARRIKRKKAITPCGRMADMHEKLPQGELIDENVLIGFLFRDDGMDNGPLLIFKQLS